VATAEIVIESSQEDLWRKQPIPLWYALPCAPLIASILATAGFIGSKPCKQLRGKMPRYKVRGNLTAGIAIFFIIMFLMPLLVIIMGETPWKMPEKERQDFWLSIWIAIGVCVGISLIVYLVSRRHVNDSVTTNEIGLEYRSLWKRAFVRWDEINEVKREPASFVVKTAQQRLRLSMFFKPEGQAKKPNWSSMKWEKGFPWGDYYADPDKCELLQEIIQKAKQAKVVMEIPDLFQRPQKHQ
jgi:hypothetical protein